MRGAWHCQVGASPAWPGVSSLGLGEIASLISTLSQCGSTYTCRFIPEIRFACCWDVEQQRKNSDLMELTCLTIGS